MFNNLQLNILFKIIKKEKSYLLSTFIMLTALFFILLTLFMGKEIFIHYSDTKSILLPKKMLVLKQSLTSVKNTLEENRIESKNYLLAQVKNFDNLSLQTTINPHNTLPKPFTLLSFDIQVTKKITLECQGEEHKLLLQNLTFKRSKDWVFTTPKIQNCLKNDKIFLITPLGKLKLALKRNNRYAKLVYTTDKDTDKIIYPYLIDLEENYFLDYFAYSKFFTLNNKYASIQTQEHAKMLHSLFRFIFAQKRAKVLLNHAAYSFLTDYKRILFTLTPQNALFEQKLIALDEVVLNLTNNKETLYPQLIIANLNSLKIKEYDYTVIFTHSDEISTSLFENVLIINRDEFKCFNQSFSKNINTVVLILALILLTLLITLVRVFIIRNYKRYHSRFTLLIFYGFDFKILSLILSGLLLLSLGSAYIFTLLLLDKLNTIFYIYYIDLIHIEFNYFYILIFLLLSIIFSYYYEKKAQKNISTNQKEA